MMKETGAQRAHQTAYVFLVCRRSQTAAEKKLQLLLVFAPSIDLAFDASRVKK